MGAKKFTQHRGQISLAMIAEGMNLARTNAKACLRMQARCMRLGERTAPLHWRFSVLKIQERSQFCGKWCCARAMTSGDRPGKTIEVTLARTSHGFSVSSPQKVQRRLTSFGRLPTPIRITATYSII